MNTEELYNDIKNLFPEARVQKSEEKVTFHQKQITSFDFTKLASICDLHSVRPHIKGSGIASLLVELTSFRKRVLSASAAS